MFVHHSHTNSPLFNPFWHWIIFVSFFKSQFKTSFNYFGDFVFSFFVVFPIAIPSGNSQLSFAISIYHNTKIFSAAHRQPFRLVYSRSSAIRRGVICLILPRLLTSLGNILMTEIVSVSTRNQQHNHVHHCKTTNESTIHTIRSCHNPFGSLCRSHYSRKRPFCSTSKVHKVHPVRVSPIFSQTSKTSQPKK